MPDPQLRYLIVVPVYKQLSVNAVLEKLVDRAKSFFQLDCACSRYGNMPPSHFYCSKLTQEAFDVASIVIEENMPHCYWCSFFDGDFVWDTNVAECANMIGEKVSDREFLKTIGLKPIRV